MKKDNYIDHENEGIDTHMYPYQPPRSSWAGTIGTISFSFVPQEEIKRGETRAPLGGLAHDLQTDDDA